MAADDIPDDYYELLGIDTSASPEEIKSGYRKEASRWHPDHIDGDEARFVAIKEANDTLSDPIARAAYDKGRMPGSSYLTPSEILWTFNGARPPESVTVRLSRHGDTPKMVEPVPISSNFWAIEDSAAVMTGDDLYDFLIVPVLLESAAVGTHRDGLRFLVDDQTVSLPIVLKVVSKTTSPPQPNGGVDPSPSRSSPVATPRPSTSEANRRLGWIIAVASATIVGIIVLASSGRGSHATTSKTTRHLPVKTPLEVQAEIDVRARHTVEAKIADLSFRCIERYVCHADPENHRLPLFIEGMDENLRIYLEKAGYRDTWTDNAGGIDGQTIGPFASNGNTQTFEYAHTFEYVSTAQEAETPESKNGTGIVGSGMLYNELEEGQHFEDGSGTKPRDISGGERWTIIWTLRDAKDHVVKQLRYSVNIVVCSYSGGYCERVGKYEHNVLEEGKTVAEGGRYSKTFYTPPVALAAAASPNEVTPQHEINLGPITGVTATQLSGTKVRIAWDNPHNPAVWGFLISENGTESEDSGFNTGPDPNGSSTVMDTSQSEPQFRPKAGELLQFCVAPFQRGLSHGQYVELPYRQDCTPQFHWR